MTEYSTGWHVESSINVHIIPRLESRKLNSVTPVVVECFLGELETDGIGRGNQVNIFRTLAAADARSPPRQQRHVAGHLHVGLLCDAVFTLLSIPAFSRCPCTRRIAMAPSPTAEAIR